MGIDPTSQVPYPSGGIYTRELNGVTSITVPVSIFRPSATDESYAGSFPDVGARAGKVARVLMGITNDGTCNFTQDMDQPVHVAGWPVSLPAGTTVTWSNDGRFGDIKLVGPWQIRAIY